MCRPKYHISKLLVVSYVVLLFWFMVKLPEVAFKIIVYVALCLYCISGYNVYFLKRGFPFEILT